MRTLLLACCFFLTQGLYAQDSVRDYFLPDMAYNPAITAPDEYLGYAAGRDGQVSHDQLLAYMRELTRLSPRLKLREYGRSHENRPLICLTITHPDNFPQLENIRQQRQTLLQGSPSRPPADMPAVVYMGYSIHGNESSGSNAALWTAYYLAAGQGAELVEQLRHAVILLDPCFNPDGLQRFSGWVNSRRNQTFTSDPAHEEYHESWPGGRTNHYWFDLNRDWLVAQQPESPGRVEILQEWLPNVLTDHHEMGSNSTFFFQPGVPSRVNPVTPARNQELTARIGDYHARMLSEKGILFFSGENYDDFYYGKGSSYPDALGGIGILFEQGSSRGSAQETDNGILRFDFTVRNQVLTTLSTLQAVSELRGELNDYLADFYRMAREAARKDPNGAYVFEAGMLDVPVQEFLRILLRNRIEVYELKQNINAGSASFSAGNAFVVPVDQPRYHLIRGIFERPVQFQDSIFYDISAWTLPDAFGLQWAGATAATFRADWLGARVDQLPVPKTTALPEKAGNAYAYLVPSDGYALPRVLSALHQRGIRVKVATQSFMLDGIRFEPGSLMIPAAGQDLEGEDLYQALRSLIDAPQQLHIARNGLTPEGPDIGSNSFTTLRAPKVLLLTGQGMSPTNTGAAWHLLDTRYHLPVTLVDADRLGRVDLEKYNVMVLAGGNPGQIQPELLRKFVAGGGTLIAIGSAVRWVQNKGLMNLRYRNPPAFPETGTRRPYGDLSEDMAARRMPGSIFMADLDLSHPICYGYRNRQLPVFLQDTLYIETAKNPYATPAVLTANPLLAGYLHPEQKNLAGGSAAVLVGGIGSGRIICFATDPNFRGFWYGNNRMFANAVFFGNIISGTAVEK